MDWKKDFLETALLDHATDKSRADAVQARCIDLAYKAPGDITAAHLQAAKMKSAAL